MWSFATFLCILHFRPRRLVGIALRDSKLKSLGIIADNESVCVCPLPLRVFHCHLTEEIEEGYYWICPSSELAKLSSGRETGLSSPLEGVDPLNSPPPARRNFARVLLRSAVNLSFCS